MACKYWLCQVKSARELKIYDVDLDENVTSKYNFALS